MGKMKPGFKFTDLVGVVGVALISFSLLGVPVKCASDSQFNSLSFRIRTLGIIGIICAFNEGNNFVSAFPPQGFHHRLGAPMPALGPHSSQEDEDSEEDDEELLESGPRIDPHITPLNRDQCLAKLLCGMSVPVTGGNSKKNYYSEYANIVSKFFEAFPLDDELQSKESLENYDDYSNEDDDKPTRINNRRKPLNSSKVGPTTPSMQLFNLALVDVAKPEDLEAKNRTKKEAIEKVSRGNRVARARKIVENLGQKLQTVRQCQSINGCPFTFKQLRSTLKKKEAERLSSSNVPLPGPIWPPGPKRKDQPAPAAPYRPKPYVNPEPRPRPSSPNQNPSSADLFSKDQEPFFPHRDTNKGDDELEEIFGPPKVSNRPFGFHQGVDENFNYEYNPDKPWRPGSPGGNSYGHRPWGAGPRPKPFNGGNNGQQRPPQRPRPQNSPSGGQKRPSRPPPRRPTTNQQQIYRNPGDSPIAPVVVQQSPKRPNAPAPATTKKPSPFPKKKISYLNSPYKKPSSSGEDDEGAEDINKVAPLELVGNSDAGEYEPTRRTSTTTEAPEESTEAPTTNKKKNKNNDDSDEYDDDDYYDDEHEDDVQDEDDDDEEEDEEDEDYSDEEEDEKEENTNVENTNVELSKGNGGNGNSGNVNGGKQQQQIKKNQGGNNDEAGENDEGGKESSGKGKNKKRKNKNKKRKNKNKNKGKNKRKKNKGKQKNKEEDEIAADEETFIAPPKKHKTTPDKYFDDENEGVDEIWTKLNFATTGGANSKPLQKLNKQEKLKIATAGSEESGKTSLEDEGDDDDDDDDDQEEDDDDDIDEEEEGLKGSLATLQKVRASSSSASNEDEADDEVDDENQSKRKKPNKAKVQARPIEREENDEVEQPISSPVTQNDGNNKSKSKTKKVSKNKKKKPAKHSSEEEDENAAADERRKHILMEIGGRPLVPKPVNEQSNAQKTTSLISNRFKFQFINPYSAAPPPGQANHVEPPPPGAYSAPMRTNFGHTQGAPPSHGVTGNAAAAAASALPFKFKLNPGPLGNLAGGPGGPNLISLGGFGGNSGSSSASMEMPDPHHPPPPTPFGPHGNGQNGMASFSRNDGSSQFSQAPGFSGSGMGGLGGASSLFKLNPLPALQNLFKKPSHDSGGENHSSPPANAFIHRPIGPESSHYRRGDRPSPASGSSNPASNKGSKGTSTKKSKGKEKKVRAKL